MKKIKKLNISNIRNKLTCFLSINTLEGFFKKTILFAQLIMCTQFLKIVTCDKVETLHAPKSHEFIFSMNNLTFKIHNFQKYYAILTTLF